MRVWGVPLIQALRAVPGVLAIPIEERRRTPDRVHYTAAAWNGGRMIRRFGVDVDYAGMVHIAQVADQVLAEAVERGLALPRAVRVDARPFIRRGRNLLGLPAQADYCADEIYINPESYEFRSRRSIRKYARRFYLKGYASTDNPGHILRHEVAHLLHARAAGIPHLEELKAQPIRGTRVLPVAGRVSRRALESPLEFVAEVAAGIWDGRQYDPEIMGLYDRFQGPEFVHTRCLD
jgi:hypothetical protein